MAANSSSSYKIRSLVTLLHQYYRVRFNAPSSHLQGVQGIVPTTRIGAKWLLGSILSIFLPFWKEKWDSFQRIEGEVEKVAEEVEGVAEVVAVVATKTENVMEGVAGKLPENSVLKEAAVAVENASAVVAKDAQLASNFIHKVEDVEQDLKDLEKMIEEPK